MRDKEKWVDMTFDVFKAIIAAGIIASATAFYEWVRDIDIHSMREVLSTIGSYAWLRITKR
jgi:hypothetical protein